MTLAVISQNTAAHVTPITDPNATALEHVSQLMGTVIRSPGRRIE